MKVDLARCPTEVVADVLGVSTETVRLRARAGVYRPVARGKYDLVQVAAAEREFQRSGGGVQTTTGVVSIQTARLKRAQADRAELDLEKRRESLIDRGEVEHVLAAVLAAVSSSVKAYGARLTADLAGESDPGVVRALLDEESRRVLEAAASQLERIVSDPSGGAEPAPKTSSLAGRVGGRRANDSKRKQ